MVYICELNFIMKLVIVILFALSCHYSFSQTGELSGQVIDISTKYASIKKVIPFATIKVYSGDTLIQETVSDSSGNYAIKNLMPVPYRIIAEEKSYETDNSLMLSTGKNMIVHSDLYLRKKQSQPSK
jgi:hypothetical protein